MFLFRSTPFCSRADSEKAMKAAMKSCDDAVFLKPLYLIVGISPICLLVNTPLHSQTAARTSRLGISTLLSVRPSLTYAIPY